MKRWVLLGVVFALSLPASAIAASGDEFKIDSFSTANAVAVDSNSCAGDDNGGIALSQSKVMLKGVDLCTFDRGTLLNAANSFSISGYDANAGDALFTDLKTNKAWAMPWTGSCGGNWSKITALDQTNGVPLGSGDITLSQSIPCPTGSNWIIASGFGRVLLVVPAINKIYDIALPSGNVSVIDKLVDISYATAEGPFSTLVAENFDGALWIVFVDGAEHTLKRWNISTGAVEPVDVATGTETNMSTLAQMVPDVENSEMYFHIESWTLLPATSGMSEPLIGTDASFSYGDPTTGPALAASGTAGKRSLAVTVSCPAVSACSVKLTGNKVGAPKAKLATKTVALNSGVTKTVTISYSRALRLAVAKGGRVQVSGQTVGGASTKITVRVPR